MASDQSFTNDLRSEALEFKRDKDHRAKWQFGSEFGHSRRVEGDKPRPVRTGGPKPSWATSYIHKSRHSVKHRRPDGGYQSADTSADEEVEPASAAPVPDAEITYSYDAEKGPSQGSQILGMALAQAIERYEVRQTDKLIKEEYEVLDAGEDDGPKAVKADEEDYQLVEA
ncbi:hypothetical protein GQ43DRAFT_474474 [Delitschia confertaspora ATCC 74209]|uniref:Uncharacterized protein n=1 Tax=Delitschia confertaspora ATCC 74209 TaxID=1513339 RepID=A0A9P4MMP6_9PLEO|nr:hypothetical protein GQ43DRAFT_474474 [Delitschia confertaspora ATCC 74209]